MYKSILVPIDMAHIETGERIIKKAQALADEGAKIMLLHVMDEVPSFARNYLPEGKIESNLHEVSEKLTALGKASGGVTGAHVRFGKAAPIILDEAQDMGADLILIASHNPGIQDYLVGSTAMRVVRHAHCTVLVDR